jgi:hypothetical protein
VVGVRKAAQVICPQGGDRFMYFSDARLHSCIFDDGRVRLLDIVTIDSHCTREKEDMDAWECARSQPVYGLVHSQQTSMQRGLIVIGHGRACRRRPLANHKEHTQQSLKSWAYIETIVSQPDSSGQADFVLGGSELEKRYGRKRPQRSHGQMHICAVRRPSHEVFPRNCLPKKRTTSALTASYAALLGGWSELGRDAKPWVVSAVREVVPEGLDGVRGPGQFTWMKRKVEVNPRELLLLGQLNEPSNLIVLDERVFIRQMPLCRHVDGLPLSHVDRAGMVDHPARDRPRLFRQESNDDSSSAAVSVDGVSGYCYSRVGRVLTLMHRGCYTSLAALRSPGCEFKMMEER